ncbi:MAG: high-affinity branched-chain amino acid ABC transporter permease LivM [Magnetococcales bacterium]|nr:high-affinity branched-chain amino acid ABC transporter permease LivM [Magnetococcales bacterium]
MKKAIQQSLITGVLAFLVFGPISGLVLAGYDVDFHGERPLIIALVVALSRFAFILLADSKKGTQLSQIIFGRRDGGVTVSSGESHNYYLLFGGIIAAFALPFILSKYWLSVAVLALIYVLLAMGLNIVVGLAGLLDLGFVAFYAVGAYGYALGFQYLGLGFWSAIPFGAFLAACFGVVLGFPVLRMHGDYLAIVTLGFGEIIRLVLNNWVSFTGGPSGVFVPPPTILGLEFTRRAKQGGEPFHQFFDIAYSGSFRTIFLYLVLLLLVISITFFVVRLRKMPLGRAWEALREDEIACRSLGINHVTTKLSAFAMGAMVGGLGGVFFAASQGFVNPTSFTFFESALILAIVVLGGLGSTIGVIVAALVLTVLPELLRDFSQYRVLLFGLAMVLMMIWRPRGLVRPKRPMFKLGSAVVAAHTPPTAESNFKVSH